MIEKYNFILFLGLGSVNIWIKPLIEIIVIAIRPRTIINAPPLKIVNSPPGIINRKNSPRIMETATAFLKGLYFIFSLDFKRVILMVNNVLCMGRCCPKGAYDLYILCVPRMANIVLLQECPIGLKSRTRGSNVLKWSKWHFFRMKKCSGLLWGMHWSKPNCVIGSDE